MKINLTNSELNIITNLISERITELENKIPDIDEKTYLEMCLLESKIHALEKMEIVKNRKLQETEFEETIVGDPMDNSSKKLMDAIKRKPLSEEEAIANDVKNILNEDHK